MENKPSTRTVQINQIRTKNDQTNYIQTARYTLYNFLPYSLFNQFRNYYNVFFLASIGVYSIEIISPVQPLYESIPFIIVLIIAVCRDGYEDYNKLQYDNVYNNSRSLAYNYTNECFEAIKWKDINIGQIIKVRRNEVIPADLVILKSSNDNGFAYMQTADLDGETNLKPREALTTTQNVSYKEESIKVKINGSFEEQLPNKNIYEIEGCLMLNDQEKMYFNQSNCLLRSGLLKNVDYIIGLVIYTGNDTKIMQNIKKEPQKLSKIDLLLNRTLFILLIIIICLPCALTGVALAFQKKNDVDGDDLNMDYVFYRRFGTHRASLTLEFFQTLASFFYIFTLLIPISVMVTLELVKTFQTFQLNKDSAYRMNPNEKTKYLSMKLHENLGDVKYIFTDKTGTLTKNEMKFKTCSIFNQVFSEDKKGDDNNTCSTQAHLKNTLSKGFKDFIIDEQVILSSSSNDDNGNCDSNNRTESELTFEEVAIEFFINIAINHNVLVASKNKEEKQVEGSYYGINPDEITLVQYAKDLGIEFVDRSVTSCRIKIFHHLYEYPILNRFDFTSERKRSSIIVRDPSGQIKMYMKGADNVILDKLNAFSKTKLELKTKEHIDKFSSEGLRTLCFAMKTLTEKEYNDWSDRYKEIQFKALGDKHLAHELENQIAIIESDMLLVGVSGLKDLLQEEVSSCIYDFLQAEINVWMLTGDKLDTAESIGRSCKLINNESEVYKIYEKDCLKTHNYLTNIKSNLDVYSSKKYNIDFDNHNRTSDTIYIEFQTNLLEEEKIHSKNFSLIIEGEAITQCLNEENSTLFFECVSQSRSVICSRCSPSQKADVVKFIKKNSKNLTLAIGDGGNDVNMLQSADIGIGIFGKEGSQAAYSSDFSFSQFKYLRRLLFVHGRFSISRNSYFVYYSFFKNVIELFTQFWHFFFSGYSGAMYFDNIYVLAYNAFLAILLPCIYSIYEEDIDSSLTFHSDKKDNETLLPKLYKEMRNSKPFSIIKFVFIVFASILFSIFFYFIPMLSYSTNILMDDGISLSMTDQSVASFLSILLFIYSIIFTDTYYFNHIVVGTYIAQFFLTSGFLLFHYVVQGNLIIDKLWDIANTKLYLIVLVTFGVNYTIVFIIRSFLRLFSQTLVNQIRSSMDKEPQLPRVILPIQKLIGIN